MIPLPAAPRVTPRPTTPTRPSPADLAVEGAARVRPPLLSSPAQAADLGVRFALWARQAAQLPHRTSRARSSHPCPAFIDPPYDPYDRLSVTSGLTSNHVPDRVVQKLKWASRRSVSRGMIKIIARGPARPCGRFGRPATPQAPYSTSRDRGPRNEGGRGFGHPPWALGRCSRGPRARPLRWAREEGRAAPRGPFNGQVRGGGTGRGCRTRGDPGGRRQGDQERRLRGPLWWTQGRGPVTLKSAPSLQLPDFPPPPSFKKRIPDTPTCFIPSALIPVSTLLSLRLSWAPAEPPKRFSCRHSASSPAYRIPTSTAAPHPSRKRRSQRYPE